LKQNTEELGSIFDAQPSTLTGNIHCTTSAAVPVIGYVTAGTVMQKRIYINYANLPSTYITTYPYDCEVDTAGVNNKHPNIDFLIPLPNAAVIITAVTQQNAIVGYLYSDHDCADCSIRGSTVAPSFWIPGPYN